MKSHLQCVLFLIFILTIIYLFPSCDLTEPQRFYNSEPEKEQTARINFLNIKDNQHFAGILPLKISFDSISFKVNSVLIFIDDKKIFQIAPDSLIKFSLNTTLWPDGEHTLNLFLTPKDMGFFTIYNQPILMYSKVLYFDQSIPDAVELINYEWAGNYPKLNWTKNNNLNFKYYIVLKGDNNNFAPIDTIYNQDITSFIDSSTYKIIGEDLTKYEIAVSNGSVNIRSNELQINNGKKLSFTIHKNFLYNYSIEIPEKKLLLIFSNRTGELSLISLVNDSIIYSIQNDHFKAISNNWKDDHIYILGNSENYPLFKLDLNTFDILEVPQMAVSFSDGASMIEGENHRLTTFGWDMEIFDEVTGQRLSSKHIDGQSLPSLMRYNLDGTILYTGESSYLRKTSVVGDSLSFLKIVFTPSSYAKDMEFVPQLNELLVIPSTPPTLLRFYNAQTMELSSELNFGTNIYPTDLFISGNNLYIAFSIAYDKNNLIKGKVSKYDLNTLQELASWYFNKSISKIFVAEQLNKLYACSADDSSWLVNLNGDN